ncbi:LysE family translocator [Streptomyces puniciscabiei]
MAAPGGALRAMRDGFVVGVTNPKNVIFFSSALPQFVDRSHGHVPLPMIVFGFVFAVIAVACDSAWSLLSSSARSWFAHAVRHEAEYILQRSCRRRCHQHRARLSHYRRRGHRPP